MAERPVLRSSRRRSRHAPQSSHGGSWKIAYADFVTALMAFFLVMWILSLDDANRKMVEDYFNDPSEYMQAYRKDPVGFVRTYRGGVNPFGKGTQAETTRPDLDSVVTASRKRFEETRRSIEAALNKNPDFRDLKQFVQIAITSEGLKIELLEGRHGLFFESGSAVVEPRAARLLAMVARKLGALPNTIAIEGHTDVVPYRGGVNYTNWELSADRANAARRVMEPAGLRRGQTAWVRGYAATRLRDPKRPSHFTNRRVSILVPY